MTTTQEAREMLTETATVTAAPRLTVAQQARALFVKDHASDYMDAGWDVVVETMTDADIAGKTHGVRSLTGAVNTIREQVVAPWVCLLLETREGTDDDPQLTMARRLQDELTENWYDATARREGRLNTVKPPRKVIAALGLAVPPAPSVIEIDLTDFLPQTDGVNLDPTSKDPELNAAAPRPAEGLLAVAVVEAVAQGEAVQADVPNLDESTIRRLGENMTKPARKPRTRRAAK